MNPTLLLCFLLACAAAQEPTAAPTLSADQAAQLDQQAKEIAEIKTEVADLKARVEAAFPVATAQAKSDALEPAKASP